MAARRVQKAEEKERKEQRERRIGRKMDLVQGRRELKYLLENVDMMNDDPVDGHSRI
jgi:hypothetical protein